VRTWTARLPGIDTRAAGGQSLIPPSAGYRWENEDLEPAEAPEWLYEALKVNAPLRQAEDAGDRPPGLLVDRKGAEVDCRTWPPAIEGQDGSGTLFSLAQRLVRGRGLSVQEAEAMLLARYNGRCVPEWSQEEIRHKCEDAATKSQTPWGYTFYHGTLPQVLRRAIRAFGPQGALAASVPFLVGPAGGMQQRDRGEGLCNAVIKVCDAMGQYVSTDEAWRIVSWWKTHVEPEALFPQSLALGSDPGPALVRLQVAAGETPAWDEFLARLSDAETFLAWVWMLTLPKVTRQCLWISGPGKDGKTVVSTVLASMLGQAATTCTDEFVEHAARWLGSQLYGKRLVVVDDTKMRQVLRRGIVHRATGGSPMKMEAKKIDGFDFIPNCAFLCTSNHTPQIGRGRADRTRLLPLTVSGEERPADTAWESRLKGELPALLHRCRAAYERLAIRPGEPELKLTAGVRAALNEAAGFDERTYEARLEAVGLALGEGKMMGTELFARLRVQPAGAEWQDFREWLLEKGVTVAHTKRGSEWAGLRCL
jgi:hypothetical protein